MISLHSVSIKNGNKTIAERLNLAIAPGTIWGILGPNGSGKTTFLHALAGLHSIEGAIHLNNQPIQDFSRKQLAQSVGILLQDFNPQLPQTVFDYCLGGRFPHQSYLNNTQEKDRQITRAALMRMNLQQLEQQIIQSLSGGERQRLALAALLTQQPRYFLLDEPTNHLDISHQVETLTHFKSLATQQNACVIMSLHDINLAQQFCDHVLLLFPQGEIIAGSVADLLNESVLSRLYHYPLRRICVADVVCWITKNI